MSLTKEQDGIEVATPELDKLMALNGENEVISSFLEWLYAEQEWEICYAESDYEYAPISFGIEGILNLYFDIDPKKIDAEKQAILDAIRAKEEGGDGAAS